MKTIDEIVGAIRRRLQEEWHLDVADPSASKWPRNYALWNVKTSAAAAATQKVRAWSFAWHDWAQEQGLTLPMAPRRIGGGEDLPDHLLVPDVDAAARIVGGGWPDRLAAARRRFEHLKASFPAAATPEALRLAEPLGATDYDLACAAARWFAERDRSEWEHLTPRQVPVPGMQGKWLNNHQPLVKALAGLDQLTLAERPTRIHFTYLDPLYRRSDRRIHDSHALTDHWSLPYAPEVLVITENKDTAFLFPEVACGIAIEGAGNASVGLLPQVPWVHDAQHIIYWGDMDPRGYEIISGLRKNGLRVQTMLMDQATYDTYERFGTNTEANGKPIPRRPWKEKLKLTTAEREVYENLTDPGWDRYLRVEQERIPLPIALDHLHAAMAADFIPEW